jgi:hypothetical protein
LGTYVGVVEVGEESWQQLGADDLEGQTLAQDGVDRDCDGIDERVSAQFPGDIQSWQDNRGDSLSVEDFDDLPKCYKTFFVDLDVLVFGTEHYLLDQLCLYVLVV